MLPPNKAELGSSHETYRPLEPADIPRSGDIDPIDVTVASMKNAESSRVVETASLAVNCLHAGVDSAGEMPRRAAHSKLNPRSKTYSTGPPPDQRDFSSCQASQAYGERGGYVPSVSPWRRCAAPDGDKSLARSEP